MCTWAKLKEGRDLGGLKKHPTVTVMERKLLRERGGGKGGKKGADLLSTCLAALRTLRLYRQGSVFSRTTKQNKQNKTS